MLSLFFVNSVKWLKVALRWLKVAVFGWPLAFITWKQLLVLNAGGLTIEFLQDRIIFWSNSGNNSTKCHIQAKLGKFLDKTNDFRHSDSQALTSHTAGECPIILQKTKEINILQLLPAPKAESVGCKYLSGNNPWEAKIKFYPKLRQIKTNYQLDCDLLLWIWIRRIFLSFLH